MSAIATDLPYRPCVGIMVFNASGQIWIGARTGGTGGRPGQQLWQMPQGGIDGPEDPRDAARRELYEETSIRSMTIVAQLADWLTYDLPDALVGIALRGQYRGQRQKWFLASFDGDEAEINVDQPGGGLYEVEFSAWKWVAPGELADLVVPFKRSVYAAVVKEFGPQIEAATGSPTPRPR